ncbi:MAG TPA: 3-methyl-2-oxobutanoate hydroxymethyltransferase [Candidatus Saccharimonadales bacterium]|nr:3-methyl-2-oxobutanoate hydroxymethyltransferase [Candidatus Saccharimonadales bacterium]
MKRLTVRDIQQLKDKGERIAVLTAYDHPSAKLLDAAGVEILLVGDSLGMVVLGYETTLPVTVDEMVHHTRAVSRARPRALVVADMPFLSYQVSTEEAVRNAGRLVQEAGADAVKLEGGGGMLPAVRAILRASIPVMGHVGLTPQSVLAFGGYRVQGKGAEAAGRVTADALALQEAGCFALVLEGVPAELGRSITERLRIPTIGIGAGPGCDGQVLVFHDFLSIHSEFAPKFVRRYAEVGTAIREAAERYVRDVKAGKFPGAEESY